MERDRMAQVADLANAVRYGQHAKDDAFREYVEQMRREAS